jgi:glycosyltransferase involved in cell wall biosynthesis
MVALPVPSKTVSIVRGLQTRAKRAKPIERERYLILGRGLRILFIASRSPYGQMHGHKMGMRTYISALKALGHEVIVAAFSIPGDEARCEDLDAKTYYLALPSHLRIGSNIFKYGLLKLKSINECLYFERAIFERVREICQTHDVEFIIADMIRTAPYAEGVGVPWILDHEDLLSDRYRMWMTRASGSENILGYLTGHIPIYLRPAARRLFRIWLNPEARVLTSREIYWTNKSAASSLRSLQEVEHLSALTRRRVFHMPVTVSIPKHPTTGLWRRPMSAVFTGGLTYQPNLDALRTYIQKVIPAFARLNVEPPLLSVIGECPGRLKNGLEHPTIRFLGYVPDVYEELKNHQVFFAPIVSGTGIKTKVLEAMACGLPVIALPDAVRGLAAEPMKHCMVAASPEEFVECYSALMKDQLLAERLGMGGRELIVQSYSIEAAAEILESEMRFALRAARHDSPQPRDSPSRKRG